MINNLKLKMNHPSLASSKIAKREKELETMNKDGGKSARSLIRR